MKTNNVINLATVRNKNRENAEMDAFVKELVAVIPLMTREEKLEAMSALERKDALTLEKIMNPYVMRNKLVSNNR